MITDDLVVVVPVRSFIRRCCCSTFGISICLRGRCDVRVVRVPEVKPVLIFIRRIYSINLQSRIRTFFLCMYYNFVSVTCLARHALTSFQLSGSWCRFVEKFHLIWRNPHIVAVQSIAQHSSRQTTVTYI